MLCANFDSDLKLFSALENFGNLVLIRKRLFKRVFAKRISIDLVSSFVSFLLKKQRNSRKTSIMKR